MEKATTPREQADYSLVQALVTIGLWTGNKKVKDDVVTFIRDLKECYPPAFPPIDETLIDQPKEQK